MRRIGIFVLIWICLFGVTFGVHALATQSDTDDRQADAQARRALDEFKTLPRRHGFAPISDSSQNPSFESALISFMRQNHEGLSGCRRRFVNRLGSASEYFEVSFVPHVVGLSGDGPGLLQNVRLEEVRIERSTLDITSTDERCIVEQFENMEFLSPSVPEGRTAEIFCFKGKADAGELAP